MKYCNNSLSNGMRAATYYTYYDFETENCMWAPLIEDGPTAQDTVRRLIDWKPMKYAGSDPCPTGEQFESQWTKLDNLFIIHECLYYEQGDMDDDLRRSLIADLEEDIQTTAGVLVLNSWKTVICQTRSIVQNTDLSSWTSVHNACYALENLSMEIYGLDELEKYGVDMLPLDQYLRETLTVLRSAQTLIDPEF